MRAIYRIFILVEFYLNQAHYNPIILAMCQHLPCSELCDIYLFVINVYYYNESMKDITCIF